MEGWRRGWGWRCIKDGIVYYIRIELSSGIFFLDFLMWKKKLLFRDTQEVGESVRKDHQVCGRTLLFRNQDKTTWTRSRE
jgi:hypothetical protein